MKNFLLGFGVGFIWCTLIFGLQVENAIKTGAGDFGGRHFMLQETTR